MNMELKVCHLYPEVLNLYGDRGNIRCLTKRLAWRGIDCRVDTMKIGEKRNLAEIGRASCRERVCLYV